MLKYLAFVFLAVCFVEIEGSDVGSLENRQDTNATKNHTGNHHHHGITDVIKFHYDRHHQAIVMTQGVKCYVLYLDHSQQMEVLSPAGLSKLELHIMTLVGTGGSHVRHMTDKERSSISHVCAHTATHFFHVSQTL